MVTFEEIEEEKIEKIEEKCSKLEISLESKLRKAEQIQTDRKASKLDRKLSVKVRQVDCRGGFFGDFSFPKKSRDSGSLKTPLSEPPLVYIDIQTFVNVYFLDFQKDQLIYFIFRFLEKSFRNATK